VAKEIITVEALINEFGELPKPDKGSSYWILYDYGTLNRYFRINFSDSLWRGLIANANVPHAVAGVYFCGFIKGTSVERSFYDILRSLNEFVNQVSELLEKPIVKFPAFEEFDVPVVKVKMEVPVLQSSIKKTWWSKLKWW
jgi:hypothetical protein